MVSPITLLRIGSTSASAVKEPGIAGILRVPAGNVASDLTGFVVRVDLADMPDSFWTGVSLTGDNIWVTDIDDVRVAADTVRCDTVLKTGELFFRATSLLTAANNDFKIFAGIDVPDGSSPYRPDRVWQDYDAMFAFSLMRNRRTPTVNDLEVVDTVSMGPAGWIALSGTGRLRYPIGTPRRTVYTMGSSFIMSALGGTNSAIMSYGTNSTNDTVRSTLRRNGSNGLMSVWNSTNDALDAPVAPVIGARHRLITVQTASPNRKLYYDGLLVGDQGGASLRPPAGAAYLMNIGAEDGSQLERFTGSLNYMYLRNGELSADWLAAEYLSWETDTFYTVI